MSIVVSAQIGLITAKEQEYDPVSTLVAPQIDKLWSQQIYVAVSRLCMFPMYTDTGYGHVVRHLQPVVSLSVGGVVQHVRSRCPCSGVWQYERMQHAT